MKTRLTVETVINTQLELRQLWYSVSGKRVDTDYRVNTGKPFLNTFS